MAHAPKQTPGGLRWPSAPGGSFQLPDIAETGLRPLTIFHAFNWRFRDILGKLWELRQSGYDAVQVSPAQKSIGGGSQWWERYQPVSYTEIEGLGSLDDLQELCTAAREKEIIVIADVVFNHMATVGSRDDWMRSKHDSGFRQELMQRLDTHFPPFTREDFNPWMECGWEDWDNENRFEVWGDSAWCDLKPTQRVMDVHCQHLDKLLTAGVQGFRFDAAKHIRPKTLKQYAEHIRAHRPDTFIYFEVLTDRVDMHELTAKVAPSTDFALCFRLRQVLVHADKPEQLTRLPLLSYDAVRFVRNHDTIMNEGFARVHDYHREHGNLLTLGWVLLLAMDGGSVLPAPRPFAPLHVALLICARCGRCWSTQTMPTGRSTAKSRWQLLRASGARCCDVVRRHTSSSSCPCAVRRYLPICVCVCVCVCVCARARACVHVYLQMIAHDCTRHGGTLLARQQEPTKQGMALQLGAHKLHAADDAGPNWGRFFAAAMGVAGKKKPAEKAKESTRDGRPEEWEEKAMDAQELKGLVAQATRERVRAYLRGHAEHLLECAREEKRQAAALNGDAAWPLQSPQKVSRAGSPARGSKKAGAGRGKPGQPAKGEKQGHQAMLVLTRGEEGFVCLNLAKEWFDVPEFKLPKSLPHGTYEESVYGFLIEVDAKHTVTAWGGDGSGHVKIGPESALVFTRTARAENDNHDTALT